MGQSYLMDSNILIDYLGNKIPLKGASFIDSIYPKISVISKIEILGWHKATKEQILRLTTSINSIFIYSLDENIIIKTIELRQQFRIKTPDAIIAATAIVNKLTLISRNTSDFINIPTLPILNPWSL